MIFSLGQSQNLITNGDFENGTAGWTGADGFLVNPSGNTYYSRTAPGGQNAWEVNLSRPVSIATPTGTGYTLTFRAWSSGAGRTIIAGIGLNQPNWENVTQTVTLTSTPQTFVLNLTNANFSNANSRIIFDMGNVAGIVNIDDVVLTQVLTPCTNGIQDPGELGIDCGGTCANPCPPPPPIASPIPPARAANTVVSMYTGTPSTYANAINATRASWSSGATQLNFNFANGTNTCIQVTNLGFFGLVNQGDVNFSAAGMTKLHLDIYLDTPLATMFFWLLSNGDQRRDIPNLVAGWNSIDINLSDFPAANLSSIYGLKFEQNGAQRQIYLDNIYFYTEGNPPTLTNFTIPAKVFGDADFTITPPTSNSSGAFSYISSNTNVATIVNGNQIHIVGVGNSTITANQAADASYGSGSTAAQLVVTAPPLAVAAPTPPARNAWDVISLYSDAYTTQSSPVWAAPGTPTDVSIAGNPTKLLSDFIVALIDFTSTDVSQMTTLHMDIYTPDVTGFNIWLLNNGDRNAQITTSLNGWNSIDIPLQTYIDKGLIMTAIKLLKFESLNGGGKTAYVDNIYFYRAATLQPPTVGTFTVPAKNLGDAPFALTPPTSNNTNPFTYISSNTNVAQISGNIVTIVGGGTSTITASQVSDGTYGPSSSFANLVVSFPAPGPSPTPPVRDASLVVSMYTGSPTVYKNAINAVQANWSKGSTQSNFSFANGSNTCIQVNNLGFFGLVNQGDVNFSAVGMQNLHIDVYVNTPLPNLFIFLLSNGDQFYETGPLVAGWNSLNINLSKYPGANLSSIYGLKFEQNVAIPNNTQIYLDNIYFSKESVVNPSQCNQTLATIDDWIYSSIIRGAQSYLWEVTELDSNGNTVGIAQTKQTQLRCLKISTLPSFAYGKSYSVRVSTRVGGIPGPYSVPCKVSTPALPASMNNCNAVLTSMDELQYSTLVKYASNYAYMVSSASLNFTKIEFRSTRTINGASISGLLPGTTYDIQVAYTNPDGSLSAYGPVCTMTTPQAVGKFTQSNDVAFNAFTYPNPFTNNFTLNVSSISQDKVVVNVYDMVGRLVEHRSANVSELESTQIGNNFQSGVYNVIVTQGENVKTLRIIKR